MTGPEILRWLSRNQKYVWAALYLSAIPAFGLAYSFMDRAFYAPNMRLEQSYDEDAKKVAEAICRLYNNMDQYRPLRLVTSNLIPEALTVDKDREAFVSEADKLAANTFNCDTPVTVSSTQPRTISVRASTSGPSNMSGGGTHYQRLEARVSDRRSTTVSLYDKTFSSSRQTASSVEYKIAELFFTAGPEEAPLLERLWRFAEGDTGFTSDVSDNLQRMIYFSAVTITTLGFGDIVPITTAARWLVTAEAVSGVVLIGLFLNSLTR